MNHSTGKNILNKPDVTYAINFPPMKRSLLTMQVFSFLKQLFRKTTFNLKKETGTSFERQKG